MVWGNKNIGKTWNSWKSKITPELERESQTKLHQSALTDHVGKENHTIDWEGVRLPAKELNYKKRGISEAIAIRKAGSMLSTEPMGTTFCWRATRSCYDVATTTW